MKPKCESCKWAGSNRSNIYGNAACLLPNNLPDKRSFKNTTNSKNFTHCDKHEFLKAKTTQP